METKTGDFFRHPRLGTVRVAETGPDFISVHQRNGSPVRLDSSEADKQLRPVPSDGFYALVYQRDPTAEWLRDNIEDVVHRIMRDRRSRSIELEEIRRELSPILNRQQHNWASWWKAARKKLLSGSRFTTDPQRKTRFLVRTTPASEESGDQIVARIQGLSDPRDFLQVAKELDTYPPSGRPGAGKLLAESIVRRLHDLDIQSQEFPELFCALCYSVNSMEPSEAGATISRVQPTDFDQMSLAPGLEIDLIFALTALSKISPAKSRDFAKALLAHAPAQLAAKAFSLLNTEGNRRLLKTALLSWINDAEAATALRIDLYLRKDFLRHLRDADLRRIYLRLLDQPRLWEMPAIREFLNSENIAVAVFNDGGTDGRKKLSILRCNAVSPELRLVLAKSAANPEDLLNLILSHLDPDTEAKTAACVGGLIPPEETGSWKLLLEAARAGDHPNLFNGLAGYLKQSIDNSSDLGLMTLAKRAAQLYEVAQAEYPEAVEDFVHSLETAGRRLQNSSAPWVSPLLQAFQSELERAKRDLVNENDKLKEEAAQITTKLNEALTETERLRDLADRLKSSASVDKQELEAQIRIEAYRPILSMLDDLERQVSSSADSSIKHLISMLQSTLERAGVQRVGMPGEICGFDPDFHEFVEEPPQLTGNPKVQVLRSGFVLKTHRGRRLIRRSAVRLQ